MIEAIGISCFIVVFTVWSAALERQLKRIAEALKEMNSLKNDELSRTS